MYVLGLRMGASMGWYLLQIAVGSALGFGVYAGFSHLAQHVPLVVTFGAALIAGLWMTLVVNRIFRLRELARVDAAQNLGHYFGPSKPDGPRRY